MAQSAFSKKIRSRTAAILWSDVAIAFFKTLTAVLITGYLWLLLVYFKPELFFFYLPRPYLIGLFLGIPSLVALFVYLREMKDIRQLTLAIEKQHPDLKERLLTAVELMEQGTESYGQSSFSRALAQSLENDMNQFLDKMGFQKVVPAKKLVMPIVVFFFVISIMMLHASAQPTVFSTGFYRMTHNVMSNFRKMAMPVKSPVPGYELIVSPGDCEIAKGTNLQIIAQTPGYSAKRVELFVRTARESIWEAFPMSRFENSQYEFTLSNLQEHTLYYVKADERQSRDFEVKLFEPLNMELALWELRFPDYMQAPMKRKQGWKQKLSVPEGTELKVHFRFNKPIASGWMLFEGKNRAPLKVVSDTELETSFQAFKDNVLSLEVVSKDGELLSGVNPLWVQVIPDLPPFLEVLEPQEQNYAFPTEEIPFEITVNDDYGIKAVTLVLNYQGKEKRIEWGPRGPIQRDLSLKPILELETLDLKSRDLVSSFVEVKDFAPDEETHTVRSANITFLIRDYVEQFSLKDDPPTLPSLRSLFEDLIVEQEKIVQETWDYLSMFPSVQSADGTIKGS